MIRKAKKSFIKQRDISDCGVACLLSCILYLDGNESLSELRVLSGTNRSGTTLLGLYQCSKKVGLNSKAYEADIAHLKNLNKLSILHLNFDNGLNHFVVLYGFSSRQNKFIIGNPSTQVEYWDEQRLLSYWKSKAILVVDRGKYFTKSKQGSSDKKKFFISQIKDDYMLLIIGSLLGIIISGLGLSISIYLQKLIDEIIPLKQINRFLIGTTILMILLVAKSIINFLRQHFLVVQSRDYNIRITGNFIEKLLRLPISFFNTRKTGDLVARLNDIGRIQRSVAYLSGTFITDLLIILISSIYLFVIEYHIAIIALSSLPLTGIIAWKYNGIVIRNNSDAMSSYASNESNYIDTIKGINDIKSVNKEVFFIEKINKYFRDYQNKSFDLGKTSNSFNFMVEIITNTIVVLIIALTSYYALEQHLKIGEMMAVISVVIILMPSCTRFMLTNLQIQEAKIAFDRMYEFTSEKSEADSFVIKEGAFNVDLVTLDVKNVSFSFPGRLPLINDANLIIQRGKITILIGGNGLGKSTMIQILQQFRAYDSGNILINDIYELKNISPISWRSIVSILPQDIQIFNSTIFENIAFSNTEDDFKKVIELCNSIHLYGYFNQFPQGLLTVIGEDGLKLSGGQRQILGLLRALFRKPQLLLLDEVTTSLDCETENIMLGLLDRLKADMAIFMISHDERHISIADFRYKIGNGTVNLINR